MKYILLTFFLVISLQANASYCYSGMYQQDIYVDDGKLYLETTTKDSNGISYISKSKTMLADTIDLSGFRILNEKYENITFSTDSGYYLIRTSCCLGNNNQRIFKLYNKNEVSEVIEGLFFRVKGLWQFMKPISFEDKVEKKIMPELSQNFEVVKRYNYYGECLLLRDKQNLYTVNLEYGDVLKTFVSADGFEIMADNRKGGAIIKTSKGIYTYNRLDDEDEKGKLNIIPDLMPSQTKGSFIDALFVENYIYDDDSFYEMNNSFFYRDLTPEFNFFGMKNGFSDIKEFIRISNADVSFFDTDSTLWARANISTWDGPPTVTFYPLIGARYIDEDKKYISYKDNAYKSGWDAAHQLNKVNMDSIGNSHKYKFTRYGSIDFSTLITADEIPLMKGKHIKNIGDKNSMFFLGSTVRIVRMCSDRGTLPTKIDFFYFFKDKSKVYYYYTGLDEMKILEGLHPDEYEPDNFEHLKILESHTNEQPIEEKYYN